VQFLCGWICNQGNYRGETLDADCRKTLPPTRVRIGEELGERFGESVCSCNLLTTRRSCEFFLKRRVVPAAHKRVSIDQDAIAWPAVLRLQTSGCR
jgi:hypothetical protein